MKGFKFILFVLCFLQILFPFFDYFLFQWRNDARFSLLSTVNLSYDLNNGYIIYSVDFTPNSFDEYVIFNYDQAVINGSNYSSKGVQKDAALFVATVYNKLTGVIVRKGFINIFSSCILLCRSVSLFLAYGFLYVISLPVFLCYDIFTGGKKREKF